VRDLVATSEVQAFDRLLRIELDNQFISFPPELSRCIQTVPHYNALNTSQLRQERKVHRRRSNSRGLYEASSLGNELL